MFITKVDFVSEDFARKWHTLGCQYRNDDIKTAAIKVGFGNLHECQRWEAEAAFVAGKVGFPFEVKEWKRYGDIPIGSNGYAGRSLNYVTGQYELGVYAADDRWERGGDTGSRPEYILNLVQRVRAALFMWRDIIYFPGLLVGYGLDREPLVLPIRSGGHDE